MKKLLLALLFVVPFQAHAVVVSYGGNLYDVNTILTSYNTDNAGAQLLRNSFWWGSSSVADWFADYFGTYFGNNINPPGGGGAYGAYFAFGTSQGGTGGDVYIRAWDLSGTGALDKDSRRYFAYAVERSAQQVPEPGTLALLGAGLLGVGMLRRRKAA
jgi:PEP-CTERM motif